MKYKVGDTVVISFVGKIDKVDEYDEHLPYRVHCNLLDGEYDWFGADAIIHCIPAPEPVKPQEPEHKFKVGDKVMHRFKDWGVGMVINTDIQNAANDYFRAGDRAETRDGLTARCEVNYPGCPFIDWWSPECNLVKVID